MRYHLRPLLLFLAIRPDGGRVHGHPWDAIIPANKSSGGTASKREGHAIQDGWVEFALEISSRAQHHLLTQGQANLGWWV